jgi:CRP/FNR family transcriptional regulator, cyclic AMP receptor protein
MSNTTRYLFHSRRRREKLHRLDALSGITLYSDCSDVELGQIDLLGAALDVPAGRVLAREGREGNEFAVIAHGDASVSRQGAELAIVGAGSFIGEMALLGATRRSATVVALSPMRLCVMTALEFERLRQIAPTVATVISRTAAERCEANRRWLTQPVS